MDETTQIFESHRRALEGLAYRMVGTHADAQDIVQETYLKWCEMDPALVRDPRAWLMTVCSRLALNALKSARARRESYVGAWLPEPFFEDETADPAARAQLDDTVSIALMLALERLTPPERAAFLLHDVFGYDFEEISAIMEKSAAACRQLAARARSHIRSGKPRFHASAEEHRHMLQAFFTAAREGDLAGLRALLADTAAMHADGGGKAQTAPAGLSGAQPIAEFIIGIWRTLREGGVAVTLVPHRFNGAPAMLVFENDHLAAALSFTVADGRIHQVFAHRNPDKLALLSRALQERPCGQHSTEAGSAVSRND